MTYYTSKISVAINVITSIVAIIGIFVGLVLFCQNVGEDGEKAATGFFTIILSALQFPFMMGFSIIIEACHRYIKSH